MGLRPLHGNIIVKVTQPPEKKTKGGLFIPGTAREEAITEGEVLACGTGHVTENGVLVALNVAVGNKVIFDQMHSTKIGDDTFLLNEREVLAIMDG